MGTFNLLPDSYLKKRMRMRVDLICVIFFGVVMACLLYVSRASEKRLRTQFSRNQVIWDQIETRGNSVKNFLKLTGQRKETIRKAKNLGRMRDQVPRSRILGVISNACTPAISLREIEFRLWHPQAKKTKKKRRGTRTVRSSGEASEKKIEEIKPRPFMVVTLMGVAESSRDATDFLATLRGNRFVKSVEPEYLQECRQGDLVYQEFRIRLEFQADPGTSDPGESAKALKSASQGGGGEK